jgi:hypothetical protein
VVPAAILFLVFGWFGSIYNAYHDIRQIWAMYLMHHHKALFMSQLAEKLAHQVRFVATDMSCVTSVSRLTPSRAQTVTKHTRGLDASSRGGSKAGSKNASFARSPSNNSKANSPTRGSPRRVSVAGQLVEDETDTELLKTLFSQHIRQLSEETHK